MTLRPHRLRLVDFETSKPAATGRTCIQLSRKEGLCLLVAAAEKAPCSPLQVHCASYERPFRATPFHLTHIKGPYEAPTLARHVRLKGELKMDPARRGDQNTQSCKTTLQWFDRGLGAYMKGGSTRALVFQSIPHPQPRTSRKLGVGDHERDEDLWYGIQTAANFSPLFPPSSPVPSPWAGFQAKDLMQ